MKTMAVDRRHLMHAARVAAVATVLIGVVYVISLGTLDVIVGRRLVSGVDAQLADRIADINGRTAYLKVSVGTDNVGTDGAPVFLWLIQPGLASVQSSNGAPSISTATLLATGAPRTVRAGGTSFRLAGIRLADGQVLVVGENLAEATHFERLLFFGEVAAGPVLALAMFLGSFAIGVRAIAPVEEARRRQLEFTADASHELRTPLSVIEAEVAVATSSERSSGEYQETLSRVAAESRRLRKIVNDLLWLARFDSEPPPAKDELIDLVAIAEGCVDRFESLAHSQGIDLSVKIGGSGSTLIVASPDWVDRLAGTLLDNACRYADSGGTVHVRVQASGQRVSLVVEDSGPGISVEARDRLFDRFHRATDVAGGSGLGLAIADSVVKSTGGRWKVGESELGGARMEVSWASGRSAGTGRATVLRGR